MSFHGMPRRTALAGDPYHRECLASGQLLAERLGLRPQDWVVTFQSRFGRAEWLQPYTEPTLRELGRAGVRRVDVVCPGFVSDCLETLEEIAMEGKQAFIESGGQDFRYIECLNESARFIDALGALTLRHACGWATERAGTVPATDAGRAPGAGSDPEGLMAGAVSGAPGPDRSCPGE
jgi:ferrochelatase